MLNNLLKT